MEKTKPQIGDSIKGDSWSWTYQLEKGEDFVDVDFLGCEFRVPLQSACKMAVNIKVTGRPKWNGVQYQSRCKVEFVGDGELSTFTGGILYHKHS